jgi:O-antigen/teichoic acid export membrane protein
MQKNLSFYTFFYLGSLIFMRMCGILAKILLARSITPYEYGIITLLIIALPGTLQIITNFCFFDVLGHSTEGKKYVSFSLLYGTITSLIIVSVFLLFHEAIFQFLNIPLQSWVLWISVLCIVLLSVTLAGVITGILRGERSHSLAASFSSAPSILRLAFIIISVYIFGITNFELILLIFALPPLVALIPVIVYKREAIYESFHSILIPDREILLFGFSFFILNAWVSLSQNINSVVISHDLGIVWQGYFDVSMSLVAVISFFSGAIYLISAPETTANSNRSEILHKRGGFADIGRLLFSMCLLCVLIIYFYSHQLVGVLFTSNYSPAGDYLIIVAIGYTVLFVQQYCAYLSISSEKEGISRLTILTIASIVAFPVFTHIMIQKFQFIGAYLAMTGLIIIYTIITLLIIKDNTPLKLLFAKFDRLVLSVAGTFFILYFFHFPLLTGLIVSSISFLIIIILSGYVDKRIVIDLLSTRKEKNS